MTTDVQDQSATEPAMDHDTLTAARKAELEHYAAIREMNQALSELEDEVAEAKADYNAIKKRFEAQAASLHSFIRRGPDYQQKLPGMADESRTKTKANAEWEQLPLSELMITDAARRSLEEKGISTLGELRRAMSGEGWWRDFSGIGETKAAAIADAWVPFFASHPEYKDADERPTRVRIVKDIEDGDFHEGDTFDVEEWNLEGQPVIEKDGQSLHLQPGDWEPAPALSIVVDDPGADDADGLDEEDDLEDASDLDDEEDDDSE